MRNWHDFNRVLIPSINNSKDALMRILYSQHPAGLDLLRPIKQKLRNPLQSKTG